MLCEELLRWESKSRIACTKVFCSFMTRYVKHKETAQRTNVKILIFE